MTQISVKVIEDSINVGGKRLLTFQLRYPRFIHAEFMTHRVFSRNASSSRAIPVHKMIANIRANPAMPIHWGKNQPGMQAREENDRLVVIPRTDVPGATAFVTREGAWYESMERAIEIAEALNEAGYHKQIVNRILEPYMHIDVICTATDYDNFFTLRRHEDAQPEIKALADAMWSAMGESTPTLLYPGMWHLPYISAKEREMRTLDVNLRSCVARCARVSYLLHDGNTPSITQDLELYNRLVVSHPMHASPAEHQATPQGREHISFVSGNFDPTWIQYRQLLQ